MNIPEFARQRPRQVDASLCQERRDCMSVSAIATQIIFHLTEGKTMQHLHKRDNKISIRVIQNFPEISVLDFIYLFFILDI